MIKPDLITCWPRNCDYPLFRQFIRRNRDRFAKVTIVFTETNQGYDYRTFVLNAFEGEDVSIIQSPGIVNDEDWRNIATNHALQYSQSELIWFTEEDFTPLPGFWEDLDEALKTYKVAAAYEGNRMHPCCIFINNQTLNSKTTRDFGIQVGKLDHFGFIQKQLQQNDIDIYRIPENSYHHMAGLSSNWRLISEGLPPNHKPEEFQQYLIDCLEVSVPLDRFWVNIATEYLNSL